MLISHSIHTPGKNGLKPAATCKICVIPYTIHIEREFIYISMEHSHIRSTLDITKIQIVNDLIHIYSDLSIKECFYIS